MGFYKIEFILEKRHIYMCVFNEMSESDTYRLICKILKSLLNELGYDGFYSLIENMKPVYIKEEDCVKDGDGLFLDLYNQRNTDLDEEYEHFKRWDINQLQEILKSGKYLYDDRDTEYIYKIHLDYKIFEWNRCYCNFESITFDNILKIDFD